MSNVGICIAIIIVLLCVGVITYEVEAIRRDKEKEKRRCIRIMREAADYSELEAKSVVYALLQTYPKVVVEALIERLEDEV